MEKDLNKVVFSCNWNYKLNTNIFTTIRKYNDFNIEKYQKGVLLRVMLKDVDMGEVVVQDVYKCPFGKIPKFVVETDTGYSYENIIGMFANLLNVDPVNLINTTVLLIVFRKTLKN